MLLIDNKLHASLIFTLISDEHIMDASWSGFGSTYLFQGLVLGL